MNIVIISGSHRRYSKSLETSLYIKKTIEDEHDVTIFDLSELHIPLWNEGFWEETDEWLFWKDISSKLSNATAIILVTPEWGGMVPPALKNFLLLCGRDELGHKPGLIVSISASKGGTNPVHELRSTGYKNNHICFIPDHIIIRDLDESKSPQECLSLERLQHHLHMLFSYAISLKEIRKDLRIMSPEFKYGES
ncbi:NAD(P)H-dependent oxidoreductase [Aeromonas veronii]|uniref:NAD(P)H-dependent oxidoreductase n=1 Tax=Aeromonas veronii TaxID=654 RepID=UPI003B9E71BE